MDMTNTETKEGPRDTQFAGFAKALLNDVRNLEYSYIERQLARRAYDLVNHTLEHVPMILYKCGAEVIPDLTELPKEREHA